MPSRFYDRNTYLTMMRSDPIKTIDSYCEQREAGKREMEYTDISIAIAMKRACDRDAKVKRCFQASEFFGEDFSFRENLDLAYCLMYIYGNVQGSPADRAYMHATAAKEIASNLNIDVEDVADIIKERGGLRKMAEAARAKRKNEKAAATNECNDWCKEDEELDHDDEDDADGLNKIREGREEGENFAYDPPIVPPTPQNRRERGQAPDTKSPEVRRREALSKLKKLAQRLGYLVVEPEKGVLADVCAMRPGSTSKLVITRADAAADWTDVIGVALED